MSENGSAITDYQFETNNTSDSAMLKEKLNSMEKQENPVTVVTDGAFAGEENTLLAAEKT